MVTIQGHPFDQITKVHGKSVAGKEAMKNMQFFTVRTLVPVLANGQNVAASFPGAPEGAVLVGDSTTQRALDVLVETISMRAQPVITSPVTVTRETLSSITDLPGETDETDGSDTVYELKFAVEHAGVWTVASLGAALNDTGVFVYNIPSGNPGNNVAITLSETL